MEVFGNTSAIPFNRNNKLHQRLLILRIEPVYLHSNVFPTFCQSCCKFRGSHFLGVKFAVAASISASITSLVIPYRVVKKRYKSWRVCQLYVVSLFTNSLLILYSKSCFTFRGASSIPIRNKFKVQSMQLQARRHPGSASDNTQNQSLRKQQKRWVEPCRHHPIRSEQITSPHHLTTTLQ